MKNFSNIKKTPKNQLGGICRSHLKLTFQNSNPNNNQPVEYHTPNNSENSSCQKLRRLNSRLGTPLSNVLDSRIYEYHYNIPSRNNSLFSHPSDIKHSNQKGSKNVGLIDDIEIAQFRQIVDRLYGEKPGG